MTTVNTLKTVFLITLMTVLLVFIGNLIGGKTGMIIALIFAVGMNFFSYWFSDKIVLKMYKAEEVNEAVKPNPEVFPEKNEPAAIAAEQDKTVKSSKLTAESKVKSEGFPKASGSALKKSSQVKKRGYSADKILRLDRIPFTGEAIPGAIAEIALKDNSHYTVQVVSAYSRVRAVEVSAGVRGRYWIYETLRNNRPWYVLINGDYATAAEARAAIKRLPHALKLSGPFIKTFSQVKFEMDKKQ